MRKIWLICLCVLMLSAAGALADEAAEQVLSVAVGQLGYASTKGGYSKYGEWGGKAYGEWCSEFVSWCVNTADETYGTRLLGEEYPLQTSCETGVEWFRERGRYVTVSGTIKGAGEQFHVADGTPVTGRAYVPQRGDLIYIEWYKYNRIDHVGIVEFVTQDSDGMYQIHTIEGNNHILGPTPTEVARYTYRLDDPSIRGYGVREASGIATELASGSAGGEVVYLQKTLKLFGFYNGDCGGKFGKGTMTAVKAYQSARKLPQTGKADAATWQCLYEELDAVQEASQARLAAQSAEKHDEMVAAACAALKSSWFGEFDPEDEAAAWERLTAPITILDVEQNEKVYLSDAPNGKRKTYKEFRGYFYGTSAAVRVLEEQDGWTKIEAYNACDELEQGWVKSHRIKTATPNRTYGVIVDKLRQRLYIYKEGKLLTTLLCSTGTTAGQNEAYNETASGEFLLCSWTGGFWAGDLWCDYAIRFNGGDLLHLVPSVPQASGALDYSRCEPALGTKASHGCVRVQRKPNEDGYNHNWMWTNFKGYKNIKIIIWDDDGRRLPEADSSMPIYYNPNGGKKYHTDARCQSVRSTYLPMTGFRYAELDRYPYTELNPCGSCGAPERPEYIREWNGAVDEAEALLGM